MARKFTIYDQFEIRGYWWQPSNPEYKIAGILSFDLDGINLELFGTLTKDEFSIKESDKFNFILGATEEGPITLHDGFQTKMNMSGIISTHLTFNKMLIGKHFSDKKDILFHSFNVNYSYVEEWMGFDPFTDDSVIEGGKLTSAGMTYNFPPVFETLVDSINATIKAGYNFDAKGERYKKKTYEHTGSLQIIPNVEQDLDWYLTITSELQNMLSFLINRPVYPKRIIAKSDLTNKEKGIRETIQIFILPMREFQEKSIRFSDRYISYHLIKDNMADILGNWFSDKAIISARRMFLRNVYNVSADWESKFLNYAKSIESLHRDVNGDTGKFITDDMYEPIKQHMIEAIDSSIDPNLKNKLISTLKYAHHFGFQRRVREMLLQLPLELQNLMFKDGKSLKAYAADITNSRDYYTHIGDIPPYHFEGWDLYLSNKRMHTILFYHLCNRLGIDKNILLSVILENDGLGLWLENAKHELKN